MARHAVRPAVGFHVRRGLGFVVKNGVGIVEGDHGGFLSTANMASSSD
jgi:hypothetical protein